MRWTIHGERVLYDSEWVRLALADVEVPGGPRFDHHVARMPANAAGTVVHDPSRGVLMLWRHRFITDTWGWEVPAGRIDPGETPVQCAIRETIEETGWRPTAVEPLVQYHPNNGFLDQVFYCFHARGAVQIGEPTDRSEAEWVEWIPVDRIRGLLAGNQIVDGLSVTAIAFALAVRQLK
jgi:8-oxo-dGTP pyrophosphatase MutT (NUDIX family)